MENPKIPREVAADLADPAVDRLGLELDLLPHDGGGGRLAARQQLHVVEDDRVVGAEPNDRDAGLVAAARNLGRPLDARESPFPEDSANPTDPPQRTI